MRYFVTGGAGFIGSSLCRHLLRAADCEVTAYDNLSNGRREYLSARSIGPGLKLIEGDVLDRDCLQSAMAGHDVVVHLAANADIALSAKETDLDLRQTVLATFNVVDSMRVVGIKKIIYSSGSGVYGDVGGRETAETYGPLLPVSMYGATKLGAEGLISAFSHLFGLQAWIFRFANVVGPRQTHGVSYDLIRKLRKDPSRLPVLGNGMQSRSKVLLPADMHGRTEFITHSERDWRVLINLWEAWRILRAFQPDVILSTGAGPVVPFAIVGKLFFGVTVVFIESITRVRKPSLTARLMYRLSDHFFYQWETLARYFPRGRFAGRLI